MAEEAKDIVIQRIEIEKSLSKNGLRIVKMTDVTVEMETLVKALCQCTGLPGNEVRKVANKMMKLLVEEGGDTDGLIDKSSVDKSASTE